MSRILEPNASEPVPAPNRSAPGYWTIPNILCGVRIIGSPLLIVFALMNWANCCLAWVLLLFLTDWLDGKLAKWLNQQSPFGARLDSFADAAFYSCVMASMIVLHPRLLREESLGIAVVIGSYFMSVTAGLIRYRRVPSYHTRLAKVSWFLVMVAVMSIFAGLSIWFLRAAFIGVTITNVEATCITAMLRQWHADVPSIFHARKLRHVHDARSDNASDSKGRHATIDRFPN